MRQLIEHMLKNMELTVGYGNNFFTMSRGSFRYSQLVQWRRDLVRTGWEATEDGFTVRFRDEKEGRDYRMDVTVRDGRYDVAMRSHPEKVNRFWVRMPSGPEEHFYGCGETYSRFDLKGEKVRIFVAEHQNTRRIAGKIVRDRIVGHDPERKQRFSAYESYYAQPTFISSRKYYLHADTDRYAEFDFRQPRRFTLRLQERPVFHMESGADFPEVSEKLGRLLNSGGKLPEWLYDGVILAIQEGKSEAKRS